MAQARSIRLFRGQLAAFARHMASIQDQAAEDNDESWVWVNQDRVILEEPVVLSEDQADWLEASPRHLNAITPLVRQLAPWVLTQSVTGYARWCILTAALSFQVRDPEAFLKKLAAWWGPGVQPEHELPSTEGGWAEVFDDSGVLLRSRMDILTELLTSKNFQLVGQGWEKKLTDGRPFNMADAVRLAKLFPKSFADPYLFKAQRAMWQFVTPMHDTLSKIEVAGSSNPSQLLAYMESEEVKVHDLLGEKLKHGGLVRDERMERAARAFMIQRQEKEAEHEPSRFEWARTEVTHHTTDY